MGKDLADLASHVSRHRNLRSLRIGLPLLQRRVNGDRGIALALTVVYAAVVVGFLPPELYLRMLVGAWLLFAAVVVLARQVGNRSTPAMTILLVQLAAAALLVMPSFPAMGGRHPAAVVIGFLGTQVAGLLWVTHRWAPGARTPNRSLASVVGFALLVFLGISVIASIPIGLILLLDAREWLPVLLVYPAYLAGALGAGAIYWVLQGIGHRPSGRYLLGVLGGFCVYFAVGPVVAILDGEPMDPVPLVVIGVVAGCLVGPAVAFGWYDDPVAPTA